MSKLLSANFPRLWRSKELWLCAAGILVFSVVTILHSANNELARENTSPIDDFYFQWVPVIGGFMAIFISLFIGAEHSDGTLKNKIIVGNSRRNIFLAYFVVCFAGSLIISAAWLIGGIPGIYLLGPFKMGFSDFAVNCLIVIGITAAYTAIFVWVSTVSTNKAQTVAFVIILLAVMVVAEVAVTEQLAWAEFSQVLEDINGETVIVDGPLNPYYVGGFKRIVLEWIRDLIPMGQAINMYNHRPLEHPVRGIIASVITTVIMNALGVVSFRKKDIK